MTGQTGYFAGLAAEDIVARDYLRRAHAVAAQRWRGQSGEIDLICRDGDTVVFVEVKKSRSFARAATAPNRLRLRAEAVPSPTKTNSISPEVDGITRLCPKSPVNPLVVAHVWAVFGRADSASSSPFSIK